MNRQVVGLLFLSIAGLFACNILQPNTQGMPPPLPTIMAAPTFVFVTPTPALFDTPIPIAIPTLDNRPLDLLIIAPEEFVQVLEPLAAHKNNTGLATKILSLESIYQTFPGRNEAEKVKHCLASYKLDRGIKYAMLVGDADKFPISYSKTDRYVSEAAYTAFFPADLYYADLFKSDGTFDDWDQNQNGYFGEIGGETNAGPLNVDKVDLKPEIAVGRVPASTTDEVKIYVTKVIGYELNAYQADWSSSVLLIGTTEYNTGACRVQDEIAAQYLQNYNVVKLYSDGNPCEKTIAPSPATITDALNKGVGFVSYIGHGNSDVWQGYYTVKDISGLNNSDRLPVIFAAACGTSEFTTLPPYDPYTDINGTYHVGTNQGEVFTTTPPQPASIQKENNIDGFGEIMTVYQSSGAIGYIGAVTGSQEWEFDLNKYFYEALANGQKTLGDMWNYMEQKYYQTHVPPLVVDPPDWTVLAEFHQPWKFFLFGDPSLRIGGVQK